MACFEPAGNAVEVERVITNSPCYCSVFAGGTLLVCLTFYAEIHDMSPADGAVVYFDVPCPHGHSIPLLYFKFLLGFYHLKFYKYIYISRTEQPVL